MTKLVLIVLLCAFNLTFAKAQKTNGLQLIINPYIQEIGNLDKRYTSIKCSTVKSTYKKYPSFQLAALYHHDFKSKLGLGVGFTWQRVESHSRFDFLSYSQPIQPIFSYWNKTTRNYIGLKTQTSYQLNNRIKLNLCLNIEATFKSKYRGDDYLNGAFYFSSHTVSQDGSIISTPIQTNKVLVSAGTPDLKIVPEININLRVIKNLSVNLGFRCKFWKKKSSLQLAKVEGFNGSENLNNQGLIYLSEIDNREFSLYVGLMYELKYLKK